MRMKSAMCLCSAICICFLMCCSILGQSATATLSGTVTDEAGAVVPGASITVTNIATGIERQAVTTDEGSFVIPLLPPSNYTVSVNRDGFAPTEVKEIILNVSDIRSLNIQLKVGEVGGTVTVEGNAPLVQTESAAVSTVVDRQFVENLPLNGRSFQSLITLTPGVVLTKATNGSLGQFSVNGQRSDANYFTIDGAGANIGVSNLNGAIGFNGGSVPGLSVLGTTSNLISVDALQEFSLQTSTYAPEFGRTPGGQVSLVSRSGTKDFSGSVFEYFRNEKLDANDWFANRNGFERQPLRQNDFGGVVGGPVWIPKIFDGHKSTFFFFSYEGLRLRQPQFVTTFVPSLRARELASSAVRAYLNAFPLPTGPETRQANGNPSGLAPLAAGFSNPSSLNAAGIRIDHNVNDKVAIFGRYNHAPSSNQRRTLSLNTILATKDTTQTLTGGATFIFSSKLNNELRLNWSRVNPQNFFTIDDFGGAAPLPDSALFPSFASSADSLVQFNLGVPGFVVGAVSNPLQRQINVIDNLSYAVGNHQLKFGVDYRYLYPRTQPNKFSLNYFVGNPATGQAFDPTGRVLETGLIFTSAADGPFFPTFHNLSLYGQDTWRVNRRLTVTYGVRWELNPPPGEREGRFPYSITGRDNAANFALDRTGSPYWETTYNNFAPRVGVAYKLFDNQKRTTVLRGGFGVFYDLGTDNAGGGLYFGSPFGASNIGFGAYPVNLATVQPPVFSGNPPYNIQVFQPDLKTPYTLQWNAAVEQSLDPSQSVTASYVAAVGRRLILREAYQTGLPQTFSRVLINRNGGTSDYHALQLQYQRRLSRGLQALASYTWSHAIDTGSGALDPSVPLSQINVGGERASSDFDVRHIFSAAVTYDFPRPRFTPVLNAVFGGWSTDVIVRVQTANPVNIVGGLEVFAFGNGIGSRRPDLVPGVPFYIEDKNLPGGRRFNPAAFKTVPPTENRQGTLGRNALRGFGLQQVDFTVRRQFKFTERYRLQLRAEFFNLFNHPNFADPNGQLFDPNFGLSTQMLGRSLGNSGGGLNALYQVGGARSIQMAVKFMF